MKNIGDAYAHGPHLHEYLQEMNRKVMSKYDVMTVGEALGISLEQTPLMVGDDRHELNMIFNFDASGSTAPAASGRAGPCPIEGHLRQARSGAECP